MAFRANLRSTKLCTGRRNNQSKNSNQTGNPCHPSSISRCRNNSHGRISTLRRRSPAVNFAFVCCLSSIILSPLNSNVKMSLHETGDIHVESEGTAASERDQCMHQGRHGVCQRRRTPLSERAPSKALEETLARSRGGGAGSRQPRPAQPPSTTRAHPSGRVAPGSHQVCRLQRPPSLRKTL